MVMSIIIAAASLFLSAFAICPWGASTNADGNCDCYTGWTPNSGGICCSPNSVYSSESGCNCIPGTSWNSVSNTCSGKLPSNCPWGTVATSAGTCVCRNGWWAAGDGQCCSPNSHWVPGSGCTCDRGLAWNGSTCAAPGPPTASRPTPPATRPPPTSSPTLRRSTPTRSPISPPTPTRSPPTSRPTSTRSPPPTPSPTSPPRSGSDVIGYYSWSWSGSQGPAGANVGIAFTGLVDVNAAISGYSTTPLKGTRYIAFGGKNSAGIVRSLNPTNVQTIGNSAATIKLAGYSGVMFDCEVVQGASAAIVSAFNGAITNLKNAGLMVGVITSHSGPYGTDTPAVGAALATAWAAHPSLDIISPQLYSTGTETRPDFSETSNCQRVGCTWSVYKNSRARFVPSIVSSDQYDSVKSWFSSTQGIDTDGYLQWKQQ